MIRIDSNVLQFKRFFLDPIALKVGPIVVRWYALAYIAGLFLGWRYCALLLKRGPFVMELQQLEDLFFYVTIGVIIGGRLGYVLFYNPGYFLQPAGNPNGWRGGMSFHGGLLGVSAVGLIISYRKNIPLLQLTDLLAAAASYWAFLW